MRDIVCADSLPWLAEHPAYGAVVTSLPDAAETGQSLEQWRAWFAHALDLCIGATHPAAPAIFFQTDRRTAGTLSKAYLVLAAAERAGVRVLWHKIVLRRHVGMTDLRRPGYSHLIALSAHMGPGQPTADVLPPGAAAYENGMPLRAALLAVRFAAQSGGPILDPFCGRGTIPAVADALGTDTTGIDIDPQQADYARRMVIRGVRGLARAS